MARPGKHTIILVQYTPSKNTRTYLDFETVNGAMDGVLKMYEHKLKQMQPQARTATYDISDLHRYIDGLPDLSALVFDPRTETYQPYGKEWIKAKVYHVLTKYVG